MTAYRGPKGSLQAPFSLRTPEFDYPIRENNVKSCQERTLRV